MGRTTRSAPKHPELLRAETAGAAALSAIEEMLRALPADQQRFDDAASAVSDWKTLLRVARAHGVACVLGDELARSEVQVGAELEQAFEEDRVFEQLRAAHFEAVLFEALEVLRAASIRVASIKGPLLGRRVYPPGAPRPATDLDLLVAERDLRAATEALQTIGYKPSATVTDDLFREYHHHIHLDRAGSPTIELHHRLFCGFGRTLESESFLARARPYLLPNTSEALLLAPEDEVLYLALHATNHRFARFGWLYDLKLLIQAEAERSLDWAEIWGRASALDVAAAVALGLWTLEQRLGVMIQRPAPTARAPLRTRAASLLLHPYAVEPSSPIAKVSYLAFSMLLCDRSSDAVRWAGQRISHFARREAHHYLGTS